MKPTRLLMLTLLATASGCKTDESAAAPAPIAAPQLPPAPSPAQVEAEAAAKAESDKKAARTAAVATALAELETENATEAARWTPALRKQASDLAAKAHKDTASGLKAILASPHRAPGHAARDAYRHPTETLTFFGLKPTMTVVELGAGGGWYTELLAPLLARRGKLVVAGPSPSGAADEMSTVYGKRLAAMVAGAPELYGKVQVAALSPPDQLELVPAGTADLVIAMREMHGLQGRGQFDAYVAAVHAALRDGGTFGVVQHRAPAGARVEDTASKGYLPEAWVIERVQAAGFKLAAKSEINANPKDTKDYERGVWTLPPNFAAGEVDKAKYAAIGESDRMTLRFTKVAGAASSLPR